MVCSNQLIPAGPAFWEAIFFGGYPQHLVQLARTLRMRFLRERYTYFTVMVKLAGEMARRILDSNLRCWPG